VKLPCVLLSAVLEGDKEEIDAMLSLVLPLLNSERPDFEFVALDSLLLSTTLENDEFFPLAFFGVGSIVLGMLTEGLSEIASSSRLSEITHDASRRGSMSASGGGWTPLIRNRRPRKSALVILLGKATPS